MATGAETPISKSLYAAPYIPSSCRPRKASSITASMRKYTMERRAPTPYAQLRRIRSRDSCRRAPVTSFRGDTRNTCRTTRAVNVS